MRVPYIWFVWSILFIGVLAYTDTFKIEIDAGRAVLWFAVGLFSCLYSEGLARNIEKEIEQAKQDKKNIEAERKDAIQKASRNY